jgi:hypothetical protein
MRKGDLSPLRDTLSNTDDAHHSSRMALRSAVGEKELLLAARAAAHKSDRSGLEAGRE